MTLFPAFTEKQQYAICCVSIAPIRLEPRHTAEQTSQLIYGEKLEILRYNEDTDWIKIRCAWDGYEGWCKMSQVLEINSREYQKTKKLISQTHDGLIRCEGKDVRIPAGSELSHAKKGKLPLGPVEGKFKGKKTEFSQLVSSADVVINNALGYLYSPYQWGGRCTAGIDCSGLVQMAYKLAGFSVLRDASQQATLGEEVHFLQEAKPGDLGFFDNAEGRIVHVGILIDQQTIIHATDTSGCVVRDKIDPAGIISVSLKKRTHNLRMLRRILPPVAL